MLRGERLFRCQNLRSAAGLLATALVVFVAAGPIYALWEGDDGNKPINDPGWSAGAEKVFNDSSRVAWFREDPIISKEWRAEGRGDAKSVSALLAAFSQIDASIKRVVLLDGVGRSTWFDLKHQPTENTLSPIEWSFGVWTTANWRPLQDMSPADLRSYDGEKLVSPPVQFDVYTGGNIRWSEVVVPKGVEIVDNRLLTHGFTMADGAVLEGTIFDIDTHKPLAAHVEVQRVEALGGGKFNYTVVKEIDTDPSGHWSMRHSPSGWHRIQAAADGYVTREICELTIYSQPNWRNINGELARTSSISGRVIDNDGIPLQAVRVNTSAVRKADGYEMPDERVTMTDAEGRFQLDNIPVGPEVLSLVKTGYCLPGVITVTAAPAKNLTLSMSPAANLRVTVDFSSKPDSHYAVTIERSDDPPRRLLNRSGVIDKNCAIEFNNLFPGNYIVRGRATSSPDEQQAEPVTVELKANVTSHVKLLVR